MQRHIAEEIVAAGMECDRRLIASLRFVEENGTPAEFLAYRAAIAPVIWDFFEKLATPAYKVFPDLAPPLLREAVERYRARDGIGPVPIDDEAERAVLLSEVQQGSYATGAAAAEQTIVRYLHNVAASTENVDVSAALRTAADHIAASLRIG
jgi:hypothetical protein